MKKKTKAKGLLERKLEDPEYRQRFDAQYESFKLEAQILSALEKKGWTYDQLAEKTQTKKSNISRDLRAGGIYSASISRVSKIAAALGMKLITLLVPKESASIFLNRVEELFFVMFNSGIASAKQPEMGQTLKSMPAAMNNNSSSGNEVKNIISRDFEFATVNYGGTEESEISRGPSKEANL